MEDIQEAILGCSSNFENQEIGIGLKKVPNFRKFQHDIILKRITLGCDAISVKKLYELFTKRYYRTGKLSLNNFKHIVSCNVPEVTFFKAFQK